MASYYGYTTNTFMNVFSSFDEFKEKLITSPLFNSNSEWTGCDKVTFQLLYNRYSSSHLSMSEESFINQFSNTLYEHFEKFEFDIDIKKQARLVEDDVWSIDGNSINNISESPNDVGTTDSEELDSLDRQTKSIVRDGISRVLYKKNDHNRAYYVKRFLEYFRYLFIKIYDPCYTQAWISDLEENLIEGGKE